MEPTRKKRRRWLIVAFVLALVSLGTWWQWPTRDARFVGKWQVTVGASTTALGTAIFHPDGKHVGRTSSGTEYHHRWWVRGETVIIRTGDLSLRELIPRVLGTNDNVQKIHSLSTEQFQLQRWDGEITTYHRIPE